MATRYVEKYFLFVSSALLILTVWAFSDNLFWDISQPSNSDPKFLVHGFFCLAWMIMLVIQSALIKSKNHATHRKLGIVGFIIALGMIVSTVYVFATIWSGWENMSPYVKANRIFFASFVVCLAFSFWFRKRSDWHKRLIIVGTFLVMEPVLSRVFGTAEMTILQGMSNSRLDFYWYVVVFTLWISLFSSLFLYDWLLLKRIHKATYFSFTWFATVWTGVHFF